MSAHEYDTKKKLASALTNQDVLVGESGGLSAVYGSEPSNSIPGLLNVETEHGPLYLDPDEEYEVLMGPEDYGIAVAEFTDLS